MPNRLPWTKNHVKSAVDRVWESAPAPWQVKLLSSFCGYAVFCKPRRMQYCSILIVARHNTPAIRQLETLSGPLPWFWRESALPKHEAYTVPLSHEAWPEQESAPDLVGEFIFLVFPWKLHLAIPFSLFGWFFFQQVRKLGEIYKNEYFDYESAQF
jgi:hypothetical protein